MTVFSIPSFHIIRWLFRKGVFFALLGLLALDGGLGVTSAFAGVTVTPTTLAYTATVGQADKSGSVTVKNTGTTAITVTWADSINFLYGITPGLSQTIPAGLSGTFTLKARNSTLAAGSYNGIATISGGGITQQVPVTLTISSTTPAPTTTSGTGFSISPATLAYSATVGSPNKTASVTVTNTGTTALTLTYYDAVPFLCCSTPGKTISVLPGASGTYTVTARLSGMAAGSYSGTATISGGGITKQVPVSLTISSTTTTLTPVIGLNTTSLGFAGKVGGPNPSAQTIGISNTGGGTLTWNVGDNAAWLTLSPLSGTNTGTVTASASLTGLLAGSYTATVTVTATGATAKTIPVTLNVASSTTSGTAFSISPATLAYTAAVGSPNKTASVTVTNTGSTSLTLTYSDAVPFLCCSTPGTTLSLLPGKSGTFTVTAKLAGMAAGSYNGTATISGGGLT
ncbi:MAG: hypothetical protein ABIR36_00360, partial [Nitrospiraceae bacterium]